MACVLYTQTHSFIRWKHDEWGNNISSNKNKAFFIRVWGEIFSISISTFSNSIFSPFTDVKSVSKEFSSLNSLEWIQWIKCLIWIFCYSYCSNCCCCCCLSFFFHFLAGWPILGLWREPIYSVLLQQRKLRFTLFIHRCFLFSRKKNDKLIEWASNMTNNEVLFSEWMFQVTWEWIWLGH